MQLMERRYPRSATVLFIRLKYKQTNKQQANNKLFFSSSFSFYFFLEAQIEYTKSKREDVFPLPFGKTDSVFLFASFFLKCCNIRSLREIKGALPCLKCYVFLIHLSRRIYFSSFWQLRQHMWNRWCQITKEVSHDSLQGRGGRS